MIHIKQDLIKMNKVKTAKTVRVTHNEKGEKEVNDLVVSRYHANGNIYRYTGMNYRKDFIYNNKNLLINTIHRRKNAKDIIIKTVVNYNYDKDNNLVSVYKNGYLEKLYKSGVEEYYINDKLERRYIFNDKKLDVRREYYCSNGDISAIHYFKHNSDDKIIEEETELSITEYFYNEDGKIAGLKTVSKEDNKILQELYYHYENNKIKILSPLVNGVKIIEYNEKELPIKDSYYKGDILQYEYITEYSYY